MLGSALINSAELNIGTENFETGNVRQFMLSKYEGLKCMCELF